MFGLSKCILLDSMCEGGGLSIKLRPLAPATDYAFMAYVVYRFRYSSRIKRCMKSFENASLFCGVVS